MGETLTLTAADGHTLGAYRADPEGPSKGSLVVVQEIFGVNSHIRSVCDRFAAAGFTAIAPALFDRIEPGIELGYTPDDVASGRDLKGKSPDDAALADIKAALDALPDGKKGVVGFCWGGYLTWLSATRIDGVDAAVSYYGGGVASKASETPKCPIIMHFGEKDANIPMDQVDTVRNAHPDVPVYVYDADHGFNCDQRGSYDAKSAAEAWERTITFFEHELS